MNISADENDYPNKVGSCFVWKNKVIPFTTVKLGGGTAFPTLSPPIPYPQRTLLPSPLSNVSTLRIILMMNSVVWFFVNVLQQMG